MQLTLLRGSKVMVDEQPPAPRAPLSSSASSSSPEPQILPPPPLSPSFSRSRDATCIHNPVRTHSYSIQRTILDKMAGDPSKHQKEPHQQQAFWGNLRIEIEPPYKGKPPEWHIEQSDSTSIPAYLSESPSETDLSQIEGGDEAFPSQGPEPPAVRMITICISSALLATGGAQSSLQIAMFIQLHFISSWWSGAFSALIGAVGLSSRWECPRMAFRVLTFVGVLLNAVAAVIDARVDHVLRGSEVFCGPPSRATGGASSVSLQDWCALEPEDLAVLSCACIIPGESPGSSKACLAFHGRAPEAEFQCYASASLLQRLLSASTGLCWALATICLCACLFRLALTCRYCLILVLSRSSSFPLVPKRWRAESAQSADRKVVAGSETGAEDKKREDPNYLQITYGKMEEGERGPPRAAGRDGGNLARHGSRGQRDVRDAYYLRDVPMPCR